MEKMTHEANTPSKPPNSPQGVQIPSPPSSSQQRRSSSPHRQAVAQKRSQKPAWDSWGFSELPSEAGTAALALGRNPDRAALKDLTASWSPTRQGFRKPELARSDDGFSRSHRRKASLQRSPRCQLSAQHVSKSKLYREEQTHKGRMQKGKQTHKGSTHHAPRAHPRSSSCSSAPHSFLQPILHSQYSNVLPDDKHDSGTESKRGDSGQSEAFKPRRKAKGSRKAAQHAKHAAVTGKEQEDRSPDLALPRVIATNSQGQGSYISPLQSPNRGQPRMNRSPAAGDSSFIIFPEAQHGRDPAQASDSDASAQQSLSQRSGAAQPASTLQHMQQSPQDSTEFQLHSGEDEEQEAGRTPNRASAHGFARVKGGSGSSQQHHDDSLRASPGLRHEMQDSLSELERLIEQQHQQLVERGVLLPAQPSSDSLTASDLDFSDLSLDASMDQLSRMADSLAEGVPPGSMALGFAALPAGGAQLAGSMPAGSGRSANYMSHGSLGSWNGLHQNRPGSQYNDRTVRQEEARQSHSGAQHSKRAPASPHACPTCCDLISEETQSDFASRLDGCSKSDTESDSKGESDSEAELLSSQVPAHRGRAAGTSPMAAQSGSHAAPPSEGISPRPFSPAHLQHRESCHQPAGTRTFPAHKQQTAAVKGSLQQQYSDSDMQQSLNLGSNDSGADDSSCFSSMPTSPQSSLQQGNAGTGLAADASSWRADAALQGKTGIWASEGPGMKPSAATASHHSALPLHSTKPALQDSSLLRPHHEPTPAAPHPTHAAFLCTHMPVVAKAPAAVKHHAASATAEGHSKRDAARSQAFLKQHSSLHSRQSVQSREAHGADVAAQPWLNDNAQAKAFASGFGTGSVQSLSEDSVPPDAAPAASEEADDSHVPSTAGASEAAARPRSADGVENAQQSKSDTVSEASDTHHNTNACAAVVTAAVHAAEPVLACGQLAERSQSEEEFEKTLADARRLRPSNQAQGHVRQCQDSSGQTAAATIEIQAEYTASSMQHHADKAVFSAIFRQTPTDPSAVNMHDDEEEEEWSEGSGEVSEEPSAAHWAAQA